MHLRLTTILAAATAALVLAPGAAFADGTADAFHDGEQVGTQAGETQSEPVALVKGRASKPTCTYQPLSAEDAVTADKFAAKGWGAAKGDGPGSWYRKICTSDTGQQTATVVWIPPRTVDPKALAEDASDRAPIPLPGMHLSPPEGSEQVVGIETWLWIDPTQWHPVSSSASAGAVTATATAVPESVTWSMGNGDKVTCPGPGVPYEAAAAAAGQKPTCSYTFRRSSARAPEGEFQLEATVTWRVTWSAVGAPGGGALGTVARTAAIPIRVAEIQAVNQ